MSEIPNHDRLIIVLGLGQSGTSIFTDTLCRHPAVELHRDGFHRNNLETDTLKSQNAVAIGRIANWFPEAAYVAMKRPLQEHNAEWFATAMPNAHYLVMIREREAVKASWRARGNDIFNHASEAFRDADALYSRYMEHAKRLECLIGPSLVRLVRYEQMAVHPRELFGDLALWLGLEDRFDTSAIQPGRHWNWKRAHHFADGTPRLRGLP